MRITATTTKTRKKSNGYARVGNIGLNYRAIAKQLHQDGITHLDHVRIRLRIFRILRRMVCGYARRMHLQLSRPEVKAIAASPMFQDLVIDLLEDIAPTPATI